MFNEFDGLNTKINGGKYEGICERSSHEHVG